MRLFGIASLSYTAFWSRVSTLRIRLASSNRVKGFCNICPQHLFNFAFGDAPLTAPIFLANNP
jgi:hypothetical protein